MSTPTIRTGANRAIDAERDARLTRLLERTVASRGVHHASFAIRSSGGRSAWSAAAGPADAAGTPMGPETPYFVASVTKRFIITLVLQCHERGELHLDDPITAHLPAPITDGLHVHRGVDHSADITIRHLASHTSGLPDYFERPKQGTSLYRRLAAGEDLGWTFEDVVRWSKEQHEPHFAPQDLSASRQRARYSDTGFQLLIRIVETATGRSFGDLLTQRIFTPLDLRDTWLPTAEQRGARPIAELFAKDRALHLPRMITSSNDLVSTTQDLLRFQQGLLGGELFTEPGTVDLLTERRNRLRNAFALQYGLGTMFFHINRATAPGPGSATLVGHSGSTGTWLFHCPELDLHLAGTIDQAKGQARPFRLMVRLVRAWCG